MNRTSRITMMAMLLSLLTGIAGAQDAPYRKKVVSYVNSVLAPSSMKLAQRHRTKITDELSQAITFERFTYAPLPPSVVRQFAEAAEGKSAYSEASIRPVIESNLAPALLTLLDVNKELLSKQNLSEAERNTFLATKAQAAGLSASQLEAILNSGFFYVPYVQEMNRSAIRGERDVKNDDGKVTGTIKYTDYTVRLKLGLLWYKLNVAKDNSAAISFTGIAQGWSNNDPIERTKRKDDGQDFDAEWLAFTDAVNVSALNIANETKKLEEFKLSGGVAEITLLGIKMSLGNREGVGLDDAYWVEENEETESGQIATVQRGFVKVRAIGDNKNNPSAFSYAQTITGTGYSPGLTVREIPQLGTNGLGGFGRIPIVISPFLGNFGLPKYDFTMLVTGETKDAYGPMAALQMNMANATGISELWFNLGAAAGYVSIPGKFFIQKFNDNGTNTIDTSNIDANLTGNVNMGFVKKFYFRRFGFFIGTTAKLFLTYVTAVGTDMNNKELTYTLLNKQFGFDGRGGLEMYLTPGLSIGAGAEYTLAARNNVWTVTVTDADNNDTKLDEAQGPIVGYKGISWFAWINYSIPSFD